MTSNQHLLMGTAPERGNSAGEMDLLGSKTGLEVFTYKVSQLYATLLIPSNYFLQHSRAGFPACTKCECHLLGMKQFWQA